jgi:hypothetical protein
VLVTIRSRLRFSDLRKLLSLLLLEDKLLLLLLLL